ncbi:MAG TPA: hypothetical protein VFJ19_02815 [Nocardioidaceae bacterium]|nr:hypothetical protein [Nocardioidaceae bacterium]
MGIDLPDRGRGRRRPGRRWPDPDDLRVQLVDLYVQQRLTSAAIAAHLGISERTVRNRLTEYGIRARHRGSYQERHSVPAEDLILLYAEAGLSAEMIAAKVGSSRNIVLRTAHDLGLAVRLGGPPARSGPTQIELIDALYADLEVTAILGEHGIGKVPPGGSVAERFPQPVPAADHVLAQLYLHAGISTRHIELLTGIPTTTIARRLRSSGVTLRRPGGRTPFLQRWRRDRSSPHSRRASTTSSFHGSGEGR